MKIVQRTESDVTVFRPEGRIDWSSLSEFSSALNRSIQEGAKKVLIDFSQTDYMSSAGLRALTDLLKQMEEAGGEIALCSLNESLKELFRIVNFDKVFTIYENEFEALDRMSA